MHPAPPAEWLSGWLLQSQRGVIQWTGRSAWPYDTDVSSSRLDFARIRLSLRLISWYLIFYTTHIVTLTSFLQNRRYLCDGFKDLHWLIFDISWVFASKWKFRIATYSTVLEKRSTDEEVRKQLLLLKRYSYYLYDGHLLRKNKKRSFHPRIMWLDHTVYVKCGKTFCQHNIVGVWNNTVVSCLFGDLSDTAPIYPLRQAWRALLAQ